MGPTEDRPVTPPRAMTWRGAAIVVALLAAAYVLAYVAVRRSGRLQSYRVLVGAIKDHEAYCEVIAEPGAVRRGIFQWDRDDVWERIFAPCITAEERWRNR